MAACRLETVLKWYSWNAFLMIVKMADLSRIFRLHVFLHFAVLLIWGSFCQHGLALHGLFFLLLVFHVQEVCNPDKLSECTEKECSGRLQEGVSNWECVTFLETQTGTLRILVALWYIPQRVPFFMENINIFIYFGPGWFIEEHCSFPS